jgi:hypothetical protein
MLRNYIFNSHRRQNYSIVFSLCHQEVSHYSTTGSNCNTTDHLTITELQSQLHCYSPSKQIIKHMKKQSRGYPPPHTPPSSSSSQPPPHRSLFLEGHRLLIDALQAGLRPSEVFLSEKAVVAPLGRVLLCALVAMQQQQQQQQPTTGVSVTAQTTTLYWVAAEVMESLTATSTSQGVCAAVPHSDDAAYAAARSPSSSSSSLVICDGVSDPGNLGTIIRTCYGMGVAGVVTVGGCNPWVRIQLLRCALLCYAVLCCAVL